MSNTVKRALKIMRVLAGKSLQGMALKDIATAINDNPVNCCRSLKDLTEEGFVTQFENKNYALSTSLLGIAKAYSLELNQAQERIAGITQRVSANANQYIA